MLSERDIPLLKAFLLREAEDFQSIASKEEWVTFRVAQIQQGLEKEKYNYVEIQSCSNLGMMERGLTLGPSSGHWDWQSGNIHVVLCSCGKNSHWGTISRASPGLVADLTE